MMAKNPFVWGDRGEQMTPEQVARRRAMAQDLAKNSADFSPVGHWTQALARGLGGYLSGRSERIAGRAEDEGIASADEFVSQSPVLSALLGGDQVSMQTPDPIQIAPGMSQAPQEARSAPGADAIRAGLVQRGLPDHVADAFVMNFQDESGLNPGINEAAPIVPGSRGGFGLAQWTGPRRRQLEAFAAQRGTPVSDMDTQLDFLMTELQGPESGAAQSILSAQDAPTAAAAIVNKFLRPAEEHRARREAAYLGGSGGAAMPAGGMQPQQGPSPVLAALAQAQSNPWVAQKYGPVLQALMQQDMQRSNAQYEQQLRQSDPAYQLGLQKSQLELDQMRNPAAPKPIEVGGVLLDPVTYEPIFDSRQNDPTSAIQEYHYAQGQGYGGSFQDFMTERQKAGATSVNVNNGSEVGTIPQGYELFTDPQTGARSLRAISGGPEDTTRMDEVKESNAAIASDTITTAAARAREAAAGRNFGSAGTSIVGMINPLSDSAEVMRQVGVLNSNAKVENLTAMRAASPTGGALGSVTEKESQMLADKSGALDPNSPTFLRDLDDYERTLLRIVHGKEAGDAIFEQSRGDAPQAGTSDDDLLRKYGG